MSSYYSVDDVLNAIAGASKVLNARKEEINRLNVFPVPDGDTGTNMSLTVENVVSNISNITKKDDVETICRAITTGALMGARGNSGVITSQILRGFCDGVIQSGSGEFDTRLLSMLFDKAVDVAFKAVRKPVEGTILSVLRDSANAATTARKKKYELEEALQFIVTEAYASVQRTPDLLPILKENNVVDAGGFGLAILFDAFVATLLGKGDDLKDEISELTSGDPKVEIEHINDWEDSQFRYCNEFLVDSETLDVNDALEFLSTMGDCELCVGASPKFKVHVHSDHPDKVLGYFLERGQISEVFIHNMEIQSVERNEKLMAEQDALASVERKPLGVIAVSAGDGNAEILQSLGVDIVVSGGQTMNPSTKDLLDAINRAHADAVIVLPDNSNIIMAAQTACDLAEIPCGIVATTSIPQAFAALFAFDEQSSLDENIQEMTEAFKELKTGEVTTAIKSSRDSHNNPIKKGDVIGIADGSLEAVGNTIEDVVMNLLKIMNADEADTLTLLAGEDYSSDSLDELVALIESSYDDLEVDAHMGGQPLYPIIFSVE